MIILGIESSCDETAAALVRDGREVLSSVVASQVAVHHPYGGVVPELASRQHLEAIAGVVARALAEAGLDRHQLDGVAATRGPGLIGSLLVGFSFAKAYAFGLQVPWIGVSHLEGHLNSVFLEPDPPTFPFVALLVSGGHTSLYHVRGHTRADLLGQTRDDAAGEAFDKVAKMLGLGYPGGVVVSALAEAGDPEKIIFPRAFLDSDHFDFSFSGLKTAVNRYIQTHSEAARGQAADIAAGFQTAVVDVLVHKLVAAAEATGCGRVALVGGVAANRRLRAQLRVAAQEKGLQAHLPSVAYCGDNAAMIAAAGYHHLKMGRTDDLDQDVYSREVGRTS
jgi:N6-L-threonylcarbamoyladenine synthase